MLTGKCIQAQGFLLFRRMFCMFSEQSPSCGVNHGVSIAHDEEPPGWDAAGNPALMRSGLVLEVVSREVWRTGSAE